MVAFDEDKLGTSNSSVIRGPVFKRSTLGVGFRDICQLSMQKGCDVRTSLMTMNDRSSFVSVRHKHYGGAFCRSLCCPVSGRLLLNLERSKQSKEPRVSIRSEHIGFRGSLYDETLEVSCSSSGFSLRRVDHYRGERNFPEVNGKWRLQSRFLWTFWSSVPFHPAASNHFWESRKTHRVMIMAVSFPARVLSKYLTYNVGRYLKAVTIPRIGNVSAGEPPFLANLPGRRSNLLYKRSPSTLFFHPARFFSSLPLPAHNTQNNSFLHYVDALDAPYSGQLCHHPPFSVLNYPHLLPTTRTNMSAAQNTSPSINVNLITGTRETPLAYPTQSTRTPWVESSVPLVIKVRVLPWVFCARPFPNTLFFV